MEQSVLMQLAGIMVLGATAQWLAWRFRLPSILLLLLTGLAAGPFLGWLNPDALLGPLLFPLVSISVVVILFEGGLSLRIVEWKQVGGVVVALVTVGVLITWVIGSAAIYGLTGLPVSLALVLGAVLVVSGPTVVGPLLRHVNPSERVGSILRWEGILIDPVGALLAVLVFEAVAGLQHSGGELGGVLPWLLLGVVKALVAGLVSGAFFALLLACLLRRHWIPDHLENSVVLMLVVVAFMIANAGQKEAGLLAVTFMGIVLANQKWAEVHHIVTFKEELRVLLISTLFLLLAARLELDQLKAVLLPGLGVVAFLILVARPLATLVSTWGSGLSWAERGFVAWMAPRGIVAAAVASIFSIELEHAGFAQAGVLIPYTFLVIIGSVTFYGLTCVPVARWLRVGQPNPQGVLIVGAQSWAREMGRALKAAGIEVRFVDSSRRKVSAARLAGLSAHQGSPLTAPFLLEGLGRVLAVTSNDEFNSLVALHLARHFGRSAVFQLPPENDEGSADVEQIPGHLRGNFLFAAQASYPYMGGRWRSGGKIVSIPVEDGFSLESLLEEWGASSLPLFLIGSDGGLLVYTMNRQPAPKPGDLLIALVTPRAEIPVVPMDRRMESNLTSLEGFASGAGV